MSNTYILLQAKTSYLQGYDVIAVLPTGFGKSLIYQLLPFIIPVKSKSNIVIVVSPLTSIIEDQLTILSERGILADVLPIEKDQDTFLADDLFS